ncbi:MAG TPA: hypothetical protein VHS78_15600 [Candidatus Elarobacter sp.]|nr:hypothetical protein [Candidatus Elarobacter sp.]
MDIVIAMIAFFALVASWFVLPSSPRVAGARTKTATSEALAQAA